MAGMFQFDERGLRIGSIEIHGSRFLVRDCLAGGGEIGPLHAFRGLVEDAIGPPRALVVQAADDGEPSSSANRFPFLALVGRSVLPNL